MLNIENLINCELANVPEGWKEGFCIRRKGKFVRNKQGFVSMSKTLKGVLSKIDFLLETGSSDDFKVCYFQPELHAEGSSVCVMVGEPNDATALFFDGYAYGNR